ncbi:MAG: hypothetical protein ABF991_03515 [Liquorilactobacillus hordei]|uniref:hypothetical protein n=1 Tax=Liquorilactobacillus hordei TaxID=468911 RepID=UPI0039E9163C
MNTGIEKGLKNIIKNVGDARPILQCAHFENGNVVATDSHQLVRYRDVAPKDLNINLNLTNFSFADDHVYPDTDRLIPTNFGMKFEVSVGKVLEILPLLKGLRNSGNSPTSMKIKDGVAELTTELFSSAGITQEINVEIQNFAGKPIDICFNSEYLLNALENIKEIRKFGNVEFKIVAPLNPFLIVYEKMDYMITPMRTY